MKDLDIEQPDQLLAYLRHTGRIEDGEVPTFQGLSGGVSNRTVLIKRASGEAWVMKQALAKLRVQVDWFSSPERIHREAMGLRWLNQLAPLNTIPALVFEDHEHHLLAMQAVPQPHVNWKTILLAGDLQWEHVEQFGRMLGTIHRRAWERQAEVAPAFADPTFFESLRVEPYYSYTASQVPEAASFIEALITATRARLLTLVHGDYSPKNILIYEDRLILLDHEVIHWGDPAFDLGFSLTHFLSKAHHRPEQRAAFGKAARLYWQVYRETVGQQGWTAGLESYAVRHTLGCLLARVAGRSTLEYLEPARRSRQQAVVIGLMAAPPATIETLVNEFIVRL